MLYSEDLVRHKTLFIPKSLCWQSPPLKYIPATLFLGIMLLSFIAQHTAFAFRLFLFTTFLPHQTVSFMSVGTQVSVKGSLGYEILHVRGRQAGWVKRPEILIT